VQGNNRQRANAINDITIKNDRTGELVATSQDLVYRKKEWFVPEA